MPRLLSFAVVALMLSSGAIAGSRPARAAQATPVASPVATPTAGPVVAGYAQVGPEYDAARAVLLERGGEIRERIFAGDIDAVYPLLEPDIQATVTEYQLQTLIPTLTTNRVSFALPEFGAVFDGHLDGATIDGFFTQGTTSQFHLERAGRPASEALVGRWEGTIGAGEGSLAFVVTFEDVAGETTATLDIPDEGLTGLALTDVTLRPAVELGEMASEGALPSTPDGGFYRARFPWGDNAINLTVGLDVAGGVTYLAVEPEYPLPPDPAAGRTITTEFRLPFDGVWWVFWGGDTVAENYHAASVSQRHAYDIAIWNDGGTYRGDGARNEDYWVWRQPLLAPAAGTVVATLDGNADNVPGETDPEQHPAGNHVVLQTGQDEFIFIAHLTEGGVMVQEGDIVAAGDVLGLAGNSGNSSEPHLHIHMQDDADFFSPDAIGLPLAFTAYAADGQPIAEGDPTQGQFVQPT